MATVSTLLILLAPFAVAVLLSWASRRSRSTHGHLGGRTDDPDWYRVSHDAEAIRTRFEQAPAWPHSGASGERR